jgi:hypothetical protein
VLSVGCTRIGVRRRYTNGTWYIAYVLSVGCTRIGVRRRYTNGTWYIACVLCQLADNTHNRQTSMPPVGYEPTIAAL